MLRDICTTSIGSSQQHLPLDTTITVKIVRLCVNKQHCVNRSISL